MAAGTWTEQALTFAFFALIARLVGVEAFGLVAMAAAFVILAEFLVRETLGEALIARAEIEPGHCDAAFRALAFFGLLLLALLLAGAGPLARLYGAPETAPLLRALAPAVPLIALGAVPVALLRREMRFGILARRSVLGVAAGGAAGLGLAFAGAGVWSLVGQRLVQVGVNVALAWGATEWRPGDRATRAHLRDLMGTGLAALGLRAAGLVLLQTPAVVAGAVFGPAAAGLLAAAWRLVETASFLLAMPLGAVAQPAFAALGRAGGDAGRFLGTLAGLAGILALAAFAGLAALAPPLVRLVLGPGWDGAAPLLTLLAPMGLWLVVERLQQGFLLARGQAGRLALLALAEAGLGVLLLVLAAPFGLMALAAAVSLRALLLWPLRFALVAQGGGPGLRSFLARLAPAVPGALLMAGSVHLLVRAMADARPVLIALAGLALGLVLFAAWAALVLRPRLAEARALFLSPRQAG